MRLLLLFCVLLCCLLVVRATAASWMRFTADPCLYDGALFVYFFDGDDDAFEWTEYSISCHSEHRSSFAMFRLRHSNTTCYNFVRCNPRCAFLAVVVRQPPPPPPPTLLETATKTKPASAQSSEFPVFAGLLSCVVLVFVFGLEVPLALL